MMRFLIKATIVVFLLLLFFCCSFPSSAQSRVFALSELVDSARKRLPLLLQKQALVNSARANVTDARNSFLPKLTLGSELSIGSANDVEGSFLPVTGIIHPISSSIRADNNNTAESGNLSSLYAEYDVVNFGLRGAKVDNAKAYLGLQQADLDKQLYVVKLQIGKLYFDILKNIYLLRVDEQNIARYQSIYTIIKAITSSGIKAGVDSSLAKAELSKTRINYNQRSRRIGQLQQQLSFLTGIPVGNIQLDTATTTKIIRHDVSSNVIDTTNNPLLGYFGKQQTLYESAEKLVRKSYLPKIIVAGGGWARGSSILYNNRYAPLEQGLGLQRYDYIAGVAITYDLFNTVHRRDRLAVNRYQTEAARFDLLQQKEALNNAAAQAQVNIQTDEKNLTELPVQLQAASDAYHQKMAQYQAGVINLIDLLNASYVLYTSQINYVETLNDWYTANLDKAASTGILDQFIQSLKNQ